MRDPKAGLTRRSVLKCSAAGTAIALSAMVHDNDTINGAEAKGTEKMAYYKADGSFDADAAKQAYFDMFKELGFPELRPGTKIRFGMYRAEFSHDRRVRQRRRPAPSRSEA